MATKAHHNYVPVRIDQSDDSPDLKEDIDQTNLSDSKPSINVHRHRYPYCIVWTPLPVITSVLPVIGHTEICKY